MFTYFNSLTQGALTDSESPASKGAHQEDQLVTEAGAPHCGENPQLAQGKDGEDQP